MQAPEAIYVCSKGHVNDDDSRSRREGVCWSCGSQVLARVEVVSLSVAEELLPFVQHRRDCEYGKSGHPGTTRCTCGMLEAVAAFRGAADRDEPTQEQREVEAQGQEDLESGYGW